MHQSKLRVHCNSCRQETRHRILREFAQFDLEGQPENWRIVRCAGCDTISFIHEHRRTDDVVPNEVEFSLYPPRLSRDPKHYVDAPDEIDMIYRETIDAFNSGLFLLCAAGLRALVEGICASEEIDDGPIVNPETGEHVKGKNGEVMRSNSLNGKIEGLAENDILTRAHARILHEHRVLGNMALHELNVPDEETLVTAIDILEHVMEGRYTIPSRADGLAKLRKEQKGRED